MTTAGHVYDQHSEEMDCQAAYNRCALATSSGVVEDELDQRPFRCHVCRIGFKKQVKIVSDSI